MYYSIDENAARTAHNMNSIFPFKEGKATADYRAAVNAASGVAEQHKHRVEAMYHEKIDGLLDAYARKLADWHNRGFVIESLCPSMTVAGPGNFPTWKKDKQNAARERHWQELEAIEALLDKIRATGTYGISSDDPDALALAKKFKARAERAEANEIEHEQSTIDALRAELARKDAEIKALDELMELYDTWTPPEHTVDWANKFEDACARVAAVRKAVN